MGNTRPPWGNLISIFTGEQSFLCAAGETGERSWGQILQSAWGGALRCFWVWVEPAYVGVRMYHPALSAPAPLRLISVLSAMTYLRLNPFHLHQVGAYPSTASLPLCPSCLDYRPNWRGKAAG
ncbi:TGFB1-induced anti-apoptotic factor 1 [Leptonychotes weddellii]|uniref:TGFB1-induced anti-apoptotic factor 1 n=1 Tax=Leptonychotes weddellii TaxID=9713 RepID=A0A2U3YB88_LEPWE|nr:TGFB1-induced anti-apoptotic factor 1 [Leptonychotes weddellii]